MKKILIIEDIESIRKLLKTFLHSENYEVFEAENGLAGLEIAAKTIPDLIISDCSMPVMDGLSVLKNLRKQTETSAIPFIFLSSNITGEHYQVGEEAGVMAYISKPFIIQDLLKEINKVFDK